MIVLGLTGSIGMGKSTNAQMFRDAGVAVFDADACVHALYAPGGAAVAAIDRAFPGVVVDGAVDRTRLSARVMDDAAALETLEGIVHPLTQSARAVFLQQAAARGDDVVVLDIPLLFETGLTTDVDAVVVVTADAEIQRQRVLARPDMTPEKLQAILARQMPDADKRARADFLIDTGLGLDAARQRVADILAAVRRGDYKRIKS